MTNKCNALCHFQTKTVLLLSRRFSVSELNLILHVGETNEKNVVSFTSTKTVCVSIHWLWKPQTMSVARLLMAPTTKHLTQKLPFVPRPGKTQRHLSPTLSVKLTLYKLAFSNNCVTASYPVGFERCKIIKCVFFQLQVWKSQNQCRSQILSLLDVFQPFLYKKRHHVLFVSTKI